MSYTKLTEDMNIIAKLSDEPNAEDGLSAAQLKAKFDQGGNILKDFLNGLIDELDAAAADGSAVNIAGMTAGDSPDDEVFLAGCDALGNRKYTVAQLRDAIGALSKSGGTVTGNVTVTGEMKSTGTVKLQGGTQSYVTLRNGQPGALTLGNMDGGAVPVENVAAPEAADQAANKGYVDETAAQSAEDAGQKISAAVSKHASDGNLHTTAAEKAGWSGKVGAVNGVAADASGNVKSSAVVTVTEGYDAGGEIVYTADKTNSEIYQLCTSGAEVRLLCKGFAALGDELLLRLCYLDPASTGAGEFTVRFNALDGNGHLVRVEIANHTLGAQTDGHILATIEDLAAGGAVASVNGKTGAVVLTAEDVGALPEGTEIPSVLWVNLVPSGTNGILTSDKTHAEILAASEAGQLVYAAIVGGPYGAPLVLQFCYCSDNIAQFVCIDRQDDRMEYVSVLEFEGSWLMYYGNLVDASRTINGKSLNSDVTLTAADVGALPLTGGTVTGDTEFSGELKSTGTFKIQGGATSYVTIQNGQPGELTLANLEGTHVPVANVATPETDYQAANKSYVDSAISAAVGAADTLLGTGEVTA